MHKKWHIPSSSLAIKAEQWVFVKLKDCVRSKVVLVKYVWNNEMDKNRNFAGIEMAGCSLRSVAKLYEGCSCFWPYLNIAFAMNKHNLIILSSLKLSLFPKCPSTTSVSLMLILTSLGSLFHTINLFFAHILITWLALVHFHWVIWLNFI